MPGSSSPRVLLAACSRAPTSDGDDDSLAGALAELGMTTEWAQWDDPVAGFDSADLVILRATWDYTLRRAEFLRWCESVPRLANSAQVARWNTHKSYLVDLAKAGIDVVPTELVEPGEDARWPDHTFVVKPAVGAGSRGAARFGPDEVVAARKHLAALHELDDGSVGATGTAVLQPYQEAVDREGETALVFLGGVYSHGFVKGPMLGQELDESGLYLAEGKYPAQPQAPMRRAAEDTMDAAAEVLGVQRGDLLYARVDLIRDPAGVPLLLELELTEPSLGFTQADAGAPGRFASAVRGFLADS